MDHASQKKIHLVNEHLTPLAMLVVVPGLLVGEMPFSIRIGCGLLIAFSLLVNYLTAEVLKFSSIAVAKLRAGSNYMVNILLLWMLYGPWPMVWILLLLMANGLAVYQDRRSTLRSALAIALLLLTVHGVLGGQTVAEWTVAGIKAAVIVISALFINALMGLTAARA